MVPMRPSLVTSSTCEQSNIRGLRFTQLPLKHIMADLMISRAKLIIVLIHAAHGNTVYSCTLLLLMRSARHLKKQLAPGLMPPLEANTRDENEALSIVSLTLSSYCLLLSCLCFRYLAPRDLEQFDEGA